MSEISESLKKLGISRKLFAVIVAILYAIPVFFPFGLPVPTSTWTTDFYDAIEELEEGDVVAWAQAQSVLETQTYRDAMRAIIYHIFDQGAKIVIFNFDLADAPAACSLLMEYCGFGGELGKEYTYPSSRVPQGRIVYGEDIVIFPYLAGEEAALITIRDNMWFFSHDIYGNSIDQIPLMQRVHTLFDCDLIVWTYQFTTFPAAAVRQWAEPMWREKHVKTLDAKRYHAIAPWYGTYVHGCLDSVRGYAEYEYLTKYYGEELGRLDARNAVWYFIIGIVVAANIYYGYTTFIKRKEAKAGA